MNLNDKNPHFQSNKKSQAKTKRPPANFVEALKSIGGSTAKSLKEDLVKPIVKDTAGSFVGQGLHRRSENNPNAFPQQENQMPDWLKEREEEIKRREKARQRHKEIVEAKPLFDRRQEEVKAEIKKLREELKALAADMANLGETVQKTIDEEVVDPGTYHVSFFESLIRFVKNLRKQVSESKNWLQMSSQRKQSQKYYWGQVKKSGTKFMLSQERYMVTQTG